MAQQRYQVIERIDAGGMAEVFKANSTSLQGFQKLVAIKRVLPSLTQNERFVRMFLDEAKVSLHLNHTNIVQVFDLGIADGTYFIVMEFVDGTNLKKIIQLLGERKQRLPVEQAVYIALEVCKGLAHAHQKRDQQDNHLSIVHRDISPPNVLMSREGEVKITDFGLAKAKSQAEITDPGVVKGKFGYLSPEAANGEDVDARTDIFAVGIVLWEMLAGRRLFLGKSDYDTLKQVQQAKIPPLSKYGREIPRDLQQILARSLTQDPATRYQSAEEMGRALAGFLFSHGMVVSAFDIAQLVESVLDKKDDKTTAADVAAGQEVQRELNQLMSLEEMGNLDLFMAEHYGQIAQDSEASGEYDGEGEDPRDWMDLGFGGEDFAGGFEGGEPPHGAPAGSDSDSWQEGGLQDVARATQSMQAIKGPKPDPKKKKQQAQQKRQRPQQNQRSPQQGQGRQGDALMNSGGQQSPPNPSGRGPNQQPQQPPPTQQPQPTQQQTPPVEQVPKNHQPDKQAVGKAAILLIGLLVLAILGAGAYLLTQM
ncbi:serine/threonine protein kinase [Persicimonas caeni]|uniref:Serine/threonine protein kinase n=1 Tax=Persicimonas caeni TaxID=2292766 RepID=A0A4Y6PP49_PERCE|nr:serine/threonine-protein kinase [Persicimonas caeni]QDG50106.1 serine/threonine protein kinase [Persicimonas caeni]QED31327.1 serine/threonine protein kinase [Persicimonas caeni]